MARLPGPPKVPAGSTADHTRSEGAYVSPAAWEETLEARLRLLCPAAGHAGQAAPATRGVPDCGGEDLEAFRARPLGAVHAVTRISRGGAPSEFALQQTLVGSYGVAVIDLTDGVRTVRPSRAETRGRSRSARRSAPVAPALRTGGRVRYGLKAVPPPRGRDVTAAKRLNAGRREGASRGGPSLEATTITRTPTTTPARPCGGVSNPSYFLSTPRARRPKSCALFARHPQHRVLYRFLMDASDFQRPNSR